MIVPFGSHHPRIGAEVFVAPDAWVIGDVELAPNVSVFFGAVLRGDILPIRVGAGTNIQEHSMLHTSHGRAPTIIGESVTIGHRAIVHGCSVGNRCLIGMGAIVLDEAVIEDECLVGAGSLITEGKHFPPRSLILGSPAKVVRQLDDAEVAQLPSGAQHYVALGTEYRRLLRSGS